MALVGTIGVGASAASAATTSTAARAASNSAKPAGTTDCTISYGSTISGFTKVADCNVSVATSGHRISARAAINDTTSGNDYVAVQVSIQRLSGGKWVTVVPGPRKAENNHAVSTIPLRACTPGRSYRAIAYYNWDHHHVLKPEYAAKVRC